MTVTQHARTRILAIATNPETGASTRFRVLQWVLALEAAGFTLTLDAFFSAGDAAALYRRGGLLSKVGSAAAGTVRRGMTLLRAPHRADVLFIHREAFPLGRRLFWSALKRFHGPIIYDYDDAMFLPQRAGRGFLARLEDLETPKAVMAMSTLVLAGNEFLATYARSYARRVVVLPTCIDTQRFVPRTRQKDPRAPLILGWIGSHTTAKYLHSLRRVLEAVARTVPFRLYVVGSPEPPTVHGVDVDVARWSLGREVEDFQRCDIGLYPLWDDPWAQGKCAFKAIQFMACGVPVVAAAVGANQHIIQDDANGYLASSEDEWVEKLTRLLVDPTLRDRFAQAGRQTIEARYSLVAHARTLVDALTNALNGRGQVPVSLARGSGLTIAMPEPALVRRSA